MRLLTLLHRSTASIAASAPLQPGLDDRAVAAPVVVVRAASAPADTLDEPPPRQVEVRDVPYLYCPYYYLPYCLLRAAAPPRAASQDHDGRAASLVTRSARGTRARWAGRQSSGIPPAKKGNTKATQGRTSMTDTVVAHAAHPSLTSSPTHWPRGCRTASEASIYKEQRGRIVRFTRCFIAGPTSASSASRPRALT